MSTKKDLSGESSRRVELALKAVMEAELERQKVAGEHLAAGERLGPGGRLAWFSNGIIFSKSGNGTPFSNGIIFSKTGALGQRPDETMIINEMVTMEVDAFHDFADRLLKLKQTQKLRQLKEG